MGRFYRKVDRFVYKLLSFEMYHHFLLHTISTSATSAHISFWKGAHLQPGDEIQIEFAIGTFFMEFTLPLAPQ